MQANQVSPLSGWQLAGLTGITLVAFAANSVLGRLGLADGESDPASFASLRLFSGALMLLLIWRLGAKSNRNVSSRGSWISATMLFAYAACFAYAYLSLTTATGALILFGAVQLTVILLSLRQGHRPPPIEWLGILCASTGFIYLMLPGVDTPDPLGFGLMLMAGIAWGIYTLRGRGSISPLTDTVFNFNRTLPFCLILLTVAMQLHPLELSTQGALYAIASGAVTSGIGYALWYRVLPQLTPTLAAVLQLTVPVIATLGGLMFVDEPISARLVLSSCLILGGILLVIRARKTPS